jgi:hypothetical protein
MGRSAQSLRFLLEATVDQTTLRAKRGPVASGRDGVTRERPAAVQPVLEPPHPRQPPVDVLGLAAVVHRHLGVGQHPEALLPQRLQARRRDVRRLEDAVTAAGPDVPISVSPTSIGLLASRLVRTACGHRTETRIPWWWWLTDSHSARPTAACFVTE